MSEQHEPYDSGDPRHVRPRIKDSKRVESRRRETLIAILSHENGRDWLYSILERCGIYQTPFSTDACVTAHNIGQQDVGRELLAAIVAADAKAYMLMLQEQENGRYSSSDSNPGTNGSGRDTSSASYTSDAGDTEGARNA